MIKKITLIGIVFWTAILFSQEKRGREKIQAYKIAYLTEVLDLTAEEATKFWPVYNAYNKNRRTLYRAEKSEIKSSIKEKGGVDNLTNKECTAMLAKISELRARQHERKLKFMKDIKSFLPDKKVLKLELAESEFNKKMMHRLKEQKGRR